jgi:AraC family transcriptional regulator
MDGFMSSSGLPDPTLQSAVPGPATVLSSSTHLEWKGFLLERHISVPGVRAGELVDRNVLAMLCSSRSRGEHRSITGSFVPYIKLRGALTILPQGPVPELRLLSRSELAYFAIEDSFLKESLAGTNGALPRSLTFQSGIRDPQLSGMFQVLISESEAGGPNGSMFAEAIALAMTIRLFKIQSQRRLPSVAVRADRDSRRLNRVKEQIEANLGNDLSLLALAKECGFSRAYFVRWFHASTGMTPHQYVLAGC